MPDLTYELSKSGVSKLDDEPDEAVERLLDDLITDDLGTIRMPYEDYTLREHLRRGFENCPERPFSGTRPEEKDLVVHSGKPPDAFAEWPASAAKDNEAYWKAWGEWTAEFACESEYNARNSMRRWSNIELWFGKGIPDTTANIVGKALIDARSSADDCPGLSAIPDDDRQWMSFVKERS